MATLQECVHAIDTANTASAADAAWILPEEEHLEALIYAQRLRRIHRKMIALADSAEAPFSAADLTLEFLEKDNAVFRRRVEAALLQDSTLTKRQATTLLRHCVLAHQHTPQLLTQLEDGSSTIATANTVLRQLALLPVPNKKRDPDGAPWEPGAYKKAAAAAKQARNRLGADLTDLTASALPLPELENQAGRLRAKHHPVSPATRAAAAKATRYVRITVAEDGMAFLNARISAGDGALIQAGLAAQAQQLRTTGHANGRSPNQLEADILVDLLTGGQAPNSVTNNPATKTNSTANPAGTPQKPAPGSAPEIVVMVEVTLAEAIKLGNYLEPERLHFLKQHFPELYEQSEKNRRFYATPRQDRPTDHPPGVADSGASVRITGSPLQLSSTDAAELLARATLIRSVLTNPFTGYPIGIGQQSYRVPEHIRQLIHYRDQTCRYPGCRRPARQTELDHVQPWADGGHTGYGTMVALCPEHHRGKTAKWFQLKQRPEQGDGALLFSDADGNNQALTVPPKGLDPIAWEAYRAESRAGTEPPF